jgi:hypothetical protein
MQTSNQIHILINKKQFSFEQEQQTAASLRAAGSIPENHILTLGKEIKGSFDFCQMIEHPAKDFVVIENDTIVILRNGLHFWSYERSNVVTVTINREKYGFDREYQSGKALKERAGIQLTDVLFRSRPNEDEVVPNDAEVRIECGDCFYSSPPADYGSATFSTVDVGIEKFECLAQPDGWIFLLISNFPLPEGYSAGNVELLVKLPPGFPDAAPDMFWVSPDVRTKTGGIPQGTTYEPLLGKQWQRFSWHLRPGSWRPGISTLRDFIRCVRSRFEFRN